MTISTISFFQGFGIGYLFSLDKKKEDEIKQGGEYYLSVPCQSSELGDLGFVVNEVAKHIFKESSLFSIAVLCNVVPIIHLPFSLFTACVKLGDYPTLINSLKKYREMTEEVIECLGEDKEQGSQSLINRIGLNLCKANLRICDCIPNQLSNRTIRTLSFFAQYTGDLIRIGMAVGGFVSLYFCSYAFGGALLLSLGIREIDRLGYVPHKFSLFMESYMPAISSIGILVGGGTLFIQAAAILRLATFFSPVNHFVSHKVSAVAHSIFSPLAVSLAEYEAPLIEQKKMKKAEITKILEDEDENYEINPAHCSKWATENIPLPTDYHFDKFLTLYDQIDWTQRYNIVGKKLKDDIENFGLFLQREFPEEIDVFTNFDAYIEKLARPRQQTKEAYAAHYLREQLVQMVSLLKGDWGAQLQGDRQDLEEAIPHCAQILPYLKSCNNRDREDILLKLAVEAGTYCARGVRRASVDIVNETVRPNILQEDATALDPNKIYETRIRQALQNQRLRYVERAYLEIKNMAPNTVGNTVGKSVHGFDIYRQLLSLGFYPLSPLERSRINMAEIPFWSMYSQFREFMLKNYQQGLDQIVMDEGQLKCCIYLTNMIEDNSNLSEEEKADLIENYITADVNDDERRLIREKNLRRLALVAMGVLRSKPQPRRS